MTEIQKKINGLKWYLAPILLGLLGGLVAFVVNYPVNKDDAWEMLIIGTIVSLIWFAVGLGAF